MMKSITCICEKKFDIDIPESIDLEKTPDVAREITTGTFMNVICPACQKVLKPEFPFTIFDDKAGWEIHFVPELARQENIKNPPVFSDNKTGRLVIGYQELYEKIKIFTEKLDDRTVEYLKYVILSKVLEKTDPEEKDIAVYYNGQKGKELIFHLEGLKDEEVGVFRVSSAVYEKTLGEIEKRAAEVPFRDFLTPPYISLNRLFSWGGYEDEE